MTLLQISSFGAARTAIADPGSLPFPPLALPSLEACAADLGLENSAAAYVLELARLAEWPRGVPTSTHDRISPEVFFLVLALHLSNSAGSTTLPIENIPSALAPVPSAVFEAWHIAERQSLCNSIVVQAQTQKFPPHFFGYSLQEAKPILILNNLICTHRNVFAEKSVIDALRLRAAHTTSNEITIETQIGSQFQLNKEQASAVKAALTNGITFLTGGPGTGKTSVVTAIVKNFIQNGGSAKDIALAAPTGKAAKRLDETVRLNFARIGEDHLVAERDPAATLHRLLGISEGQKLPVHHAAFPLPHKMIIVDEASMIDVSLFEKLIAAIRPNAHVVLLGDASQLPSVEAGALFRAFTQSAEFQKQTHRLVTSYRMNPSSKGAGRNILLVANAVNKGEVVFSDSSQATTRDPDAVVKLASSTAALSENGVTFFSAKDFEKQFLALLKNWLPPIPQNPTDSLNAMCELLEKRKILCVTNSGRYGADTLNTVLHGLYAANLQKRQTQPPSQPHTAFLHGEPVIVVGNDYSRNIFNGDIGVVAEILAGETTTLHVAFRKPGASPTLIPLEAIAQNIKHAFAITVHKSQGSEYESILFCLPERDGPLCSREIVYTALTRASHQCVVWGERTILQASVARRLARTSLLDAN
jgi:exodeoxyribonuclease V alpha subunit